MMIIGLLLIAAVIYLLFKKESGLRKRDDESPLAILQKRYVNGEIDEQEYLQKKETLRQR